MGNGVIWIHHDRTTHANVTKFSHVHRPYFSWLRCFDTSKFVSKAISVMVISAIDCGVPRDILNTSRTVGQTTLNQVVEYSCASGYQFNINGRLSLSANCSTQGIWTLEDGNNLDNVDISCERMYFLTICLNMGKIQLQFCSANRNTQQLHCQK